MIGDRLIITSRAKKIATSIKSILSNESIIIICGNSGTEKSETADCLQELLFKDKKQSIVLSLDDYYSYSIVNRNYGVDFVFENDIIERITDENI